MKNSILKIASSFLLLFGCVSIFMTVSVIFDLHGIRKLEGNYVLFVVYANLVCGVIYLLASYGFFKQKKWTTLLLGVAFFILIIAFIGLGLYIYAGEIHEDKTVNAMIFRIFITLLLYYVAWKFISSKKLMNTQT
jgi:uncharacterized membrane protein (DUF2068 family)